VRVLIGSARSQNESVNSPRPAMGIVNCCVRCVQRKAPPAAQLGGARGTVASESEFTSAKIRHPRALICSSSVGLVPWRL